MFEEDETTWNMGYPDGQGAQYQHDGKYYGIRKHYLPWHTGNGGDGVKPRDMAVWIAEHPHKKPRVKKVEPVAEEPKKMRAADLLMLQEEYKFFEWKKLAKDILGKDTPAKKKDIIAALEKRAADVKQSKKPTALTWSQQTGSIDLYAWAADEQDYLFADVAKEIHKKHNKRCSKMGDALDFLSSLGIDVKRE